MEVGPLARMLVAYASGHPGRQGPCRCDAGKVKASPSALFSTLGRVAARALETQLLASRLVGWIEQLGNNLASGNVRIHNGEKWDPNSWPKTAQGFGFFEAPRGSLGHWVQIEDQAIKNYQAVVPSTWNAAHQMREGQRGATIGPPQEEASRRSGTSARSFCAPSTPSTRAWRAPFMWLTLEGMCSRVRKPDRAEGCL